MEKVTTRPCSFKRSGRQAPFSLTPVLRPVHAQHGRKESRFNGSTHFYQGEPPPKCTGIDGKPLKRLVSIFLRRGARLKTGVNKSTIDSQRCLPVRAGPTSADLTQGNEQFPLQLQHLFPLARRNVIESREMQQSMQQIKPNFTSERAAKHFRLSRGRLDADHDFTVPKGEHVGRASQAAKFLV